MSFPSPARDWWEVPLSLDDLCDVKNPAVFLFRYEGINLRFVKKGAVLVVDRSLKPKATDLVVIALHDEMLVKPFEDLPKSDALSIEGVVTRVLNVMR